jgi:hypothetical protein
VGDRGERYRDTFTVPLPDGRRVLHRPTKVTISRPAKHDTHENPVITIAFRDADNPRHPAPDGANRGAEPADAPNRNLLDEIRTWRTS